MWKRFTALNTRKWLDILPALIKQYNNTKHSTIRMTPVEASLSKNESLLVARQQAQLQGQPLKTTKFNLGDKVRISRIKGIFEQGYLPNWSEELYEIVKVKNTTPTNLYSKRC